MSTPNDPLGDARPIDASALANAARFDDRGLVTVVAQDALSGEVRMLAHANREALEQTFATGDAHFYSRSRKRLWRKGEESGNTLRVQSVLLDCDGDAVVYLVDPKGPTCHTGAVGCFYRDARVEGEGDARAVALHDGARALPFMERLEAVLALRKAADAGKSYTRALLDAGAGRIGEKLREEADELARAVAGESDERVASEAADVVYHLLVGLTLRGVPWRAVLGELAKRFGTGGLAEKAARTKT